MRAVLLLAACLLSNAMWLIAFHCLTHRTDVHRADFQICAPVHNGPIERPDHYTTHPWRSRGAIA